MPKKTFKIFSLLLILILNFLIIGLPLIEVKADAPPPAGIDNPLGTESFTVLFNRIINWVLGIVVLLASLAIVIGGVQYMTSGGNEEKVANARKTIQWSLIGLGIILLSGGLLRALLEIFGIE